jgi:hypothetical protein
VPRANNTSTSGHGSADAAGAGALSSTEAAITAPAPTAVASRRARFLINFKTSISTHRFASFGARCLVFDADCGRDCQKPHFSTAWRAIWAPTAIAFPHNLRLGTMPWHGSVLRRDILRAELSLTTPAKLAPARAAALCVNAAVADEATIGPRSCWRRTSTQLGCAITVLDIGSC